MSFANHFPQEKFTLFVGNIKDRLAGRITENQELDRYWEILGNEFSARFGSYLKELRQQGRLNAIEGLDSLELRYLSAWNRFVKAETDVLDWALAHNFVSIHLCSLQRAEIEENVTPDLVEQVYQSIIANVKKGDVPGCYFASWDQSRVTGQKVFYELKNWALACFSMDAKGNRVSLTPPGVPSVKINAITLETGHLIMTDWIKIKEFTGAIDEDSLDTLINSPAGREKYLECTAKQFNFLLISADYGGATIYEKDGLFMAGFVNEDLGEDHAESISRQFINHGGVHTDGVTFTIIEKENLIGIIGQTVGLEKAGELVEAYLSGHKDNLLEINVEPGTYYCYSMGDHKLLGKHISEYEHPFANIESQVFIFGNRKLELSSALGI